MCKSLQSFLSLILRKFSPDVPVSRLRVKGSHQPTWPPERNTKTTTVLAEHHNKKSLVSQRTEGLDEEGNFFSNS